MLPATATQSSVHSSPGSSCQGTDAWVHWGPANLHFGASLGEESPLGVDKSTRPSVWCRVDFNFGAGLECVSVYGRSWSCSRWLAGGSITWVRPNPACREGVPGHSGLGPSLAKAGYVLGR